MLRRHRRRHRYEQFSAGHSRSQVHRTVIVVLLLGSIFYISARETLKWFGVGEYEERTAALLSVEDAHNVSVSLEGGSLQRAQDGLKLYPNDLIKTGINAHALVSFFDGSSLRLAPDTKAHINESLKGSRISIVDIILDEGSLWFVSPAQEVFTGSIMRRITTPHYTAIIPQQSEIHAHTGRLQVFDGDGPGIELTPAQSESSIYIGEGQQFTFPTTDDLSDDLYQYRSAFGTLPSDEFIESSRTLLAQTAYSDDMPTQEEEQMPDDDLLVVNKPKDGIFVREKSITVEGRVGEGVDGIRINGYRAEVSREDGTFSHELSLADEEEVIVHIEALDTLGIPIAETQRILKRDIQPPQSPEILEPAPTGATYRTQSTEFEIKGTVSSDTVAVEVNDYRLQLFRLGDTQWNYLASTILGNIDWGSNTYSVIAIDTYGNESEPSLITILLEEGEEGIVEDPTTLVDEKKEEDNSYESKDKVENELRGARKPEPVKTNLIDNPPLDPGSLRIIGPTQGEPFTATGSEFSIYGAVPSGTFSVWVNGYRLRLYEPGQPIFKYIASYALGTMKRGKNVYEMVIRNRKGEVIDKKEYVVNYRAGN
jgi:uncharacterized membrane protein